MAITYYLVISVFCSFLLQAQFDSHTYDKESFLIGTVSEYMGYQRTFTGRDDFLYHRVDILSQDELQLALFIDSLFSPDYPDITIVDNGASLRIKLYSPALSSEIDDYFNYEPSGMTMAHRDTVYIGKLKKKVFANEKQKLSFLLGAYLRYGEDRDKANSLIQLLKKEKLLKKNYDNSAHVIFMTNAPLKAQRCEKLLKELGSKKVKYVYRKSVPAGNLVLFNPSPKIMKIINEADRLQNEINSIPTSTVKFTSDGSKYIWKEPLKPTRQN